VHALKDHPPPAGVAQPDRWQGSGQFAADAPDAAAPSALLLVMSPVVPSIANRSSLRLKWAMHYN
jgi:hypothetical protein